MCVLITTTWITYPFIHTCNFECFFHPFKHPFNIFFKWNHSFCCFWCFKWFLWNFRCLHPNNFQTLLIKKINNFLFVCFVFSMPNTAMWLTHSKKKMTLSCSVILRISLWNYIMWRFITCVFDEIRICGLFFFFFPLLFSQVSMLFENEQMNSLLHKRNHCSNLVVKHANPFEETWTSCEIPMTFMKTNNVTNMMMTN